ncbi:hypothetical protein BGZ72_001852 [Mortierella alpina]|nr:hypothetical protein BGZ72_001852 [Mortierella alpina]
MAMTLSETSANSDDSSDESSETSVLGSMSYVERRADLTDPRLLERILNVCMHKLQRVSYGRHECLSRQVQLSCMLHRLRMQSFQLQQQQLQQQPLVFDQDMSSLHSLDSISAYDWDQSATLGPNPLSSNLSLDMLLSMGSPNGSSDSSASPSSTNDVDQQDIFSLGPLPQQQNSLSSIPLVPFSGDYSATVGSPSPIVLSSIPSLPTSSSSQDQPLATAAALPQQTYYELLMAANPNEPLSQLLSTSATTLGPSSFTTASPTHPSAYAVLDCPVPSFATVSASSAPTVVSQSIPSADQISAAFSVATIPISAPSDGLQQTVPLTTKEIMDALSGQFPIQPIQPVQSVQPISASQMDIDLPVAQSSPVQDSFPVTIKSTAYRSTGPALSSTKVSSAPETAARPSPSLSDTSVAAAVLAAIRAVETFGRGDDATDNSTAPVETDASEQPGSVSSVNATAPLFTSAALDLEKVSKKLADINAEGHTSSARPLLVSRVTGVDAASDSAIPEDYSRESIDNSGSPEPVFEPEESLDTSTTTSSPPPAPARVSARSRKSDRSPAMQRRSSRASNRPYKERHVHSRNSEGSEDVQDEDEQLSKRARSSDEDASSSSCSSPESSPPSPKTPPPLADNHSTIHEHAGHLVRGIKSLDSDHDDDQLASRHDHGRELKSLKRSSHKVCEEGVETPKPKKKKGVRVRTTQSMDGEEPEDESDAGILSPSLLPRYSSSQMTTRRSARINRHRSHVELSDAHSLASSNVPKLVGGRASRPAAA